MAATLAPTSPWGGEVGSRSETGEGGAIEGECYFRGIAGERFAVRNSGAIAVI